MKKSRFRFNALLLVLLIALMLTSVAGAAPKNGAVVSLSVTQGKFATSDDVLVTVTIYNPTKNPVKVLKWYTPANQTAERLFAVTRDGEPVAYTGPVYKRVPPTDNDYISLRAGASIVGTVNLGEFYDLSQNGQYEVAFAVAAFNLFDEKANLFQTRDVLISQKIKLEVDGREAKGTATPIPPGGGGKGTPTSPSPDTPTSSPPNTPTATAPGPITATSTPSSGGGKRTPTPALPTATLPGGGGTPTPTSPGGGGSNTFIACTSTRQSQLVSARNEAKIYASSAENYLLANTLNSRYTTWFGVFSSTRYNTVKSNFTAISNAMDNANVRFDCTCTQTNVYAYVYPNEPYGIYLCGAFWNAPMTGTDSKAGTLIHEMSHFNVVAGTDDLAYGQTAARNLAINNPDGAVQNADSHEYFAENTPPLP